MRKLFTALVLLPAALATPTVAQDGEAAHWNQWRGPGRDGSAEIFGSLRHWPQAPTKLWDVATGSGHAAPVVDSERVYLFSRHGEDEVVAAHGLADGRELWSQRYPVKFKARMGGGHHGAGPKSTPVVEGGLLVTFGITGVLSCWDAETGERRWQIDFSERIDDPLPRWGTALSPLIHDRRLIVHYGKDTGAILALDPATGEEIWRHGDVGPSYASPIVTEIAGSTQLVMLTIDGLLALDLEGKKLWSHDWPMSYMQQNMATPIDFGDLVVIASESRPTTAVRPTVKAGKWQAEVAWERDDLAMDMSTAVVAGDRLCGLSRVKKGLAFCLDHEGNDLWLGKPRFAEFASLVVTPDALLYLLSDGSLVALARSGGAYGELARYTLADSETWAHPAVIEGGLIVKSYDRLARFDFSASP